MSTPPSHNTTNALLIQLLQAVAAAAPAPAAEHTPSSPSPTVTASAPERISFWDDDPNFRLSEQRPDSYPPGWLVDLCPEILPSDPELFFTERRSDEETKEFQRGYPNTHGRLYTPKTIPQSFSVSKNCQSTDKILVKLQEAVANATRPVDLLLYAVLKNDDAPDIIREAVSSFGAVMLRALGDLAAQINDQRVELLRQDKSLPKKDALRPLVSPEAYRAEIKREKCGPRVHGGFTLLSRSSLPHSNHFAPSIHHQCPSPVMDIAISVNCVVNGDPTSKAFAIKTYSLRSVAHLRKLIKAEKTHRFNEVLAGELTLWRVSCPVFSSFKHKPIAVTEIQSATKLSPVEDLVDVLEDQLPNSTLYIIVQQPHRVSEITTGATFTVKVKGRTPLIFQWAADTATATLKELRDIVYNQQQWNSKVWTEGSVVIEQPNCKEVIYPESDQDLRSYLQTNGDRQISIRLEGRPRPFPEFTLSDSDRIYGDQNLKELGSAGSTPLTSPAHLQAVDDLLRTLKSTVMAMWTGESMSSEAGSSLYVAVFLIHAVGLFPELTMCPNKAISGRRGSGCLDYAIVSKDDPSRMLAVTIRGPTECNSVSRNMVQLDTITSGRKWKLQDANDQHGSALTGQKRKFQDDSRDGDNASPVFSYGIVTDATTWTFLECKTDVLHESGYNDPTFSLSTSPVLLHFSNEFGDWATKATQVFGHIVYQLQRLVDDGPNRLNPPSLPNSLKNPQMSNIQNPTQIFNDYWVWAQSLSKEYRSGPRVGKWMLFYSKAALDEKWAIVKHLTEQDELGGLAKCSTAKENPNAKNSKAGVIIVYTYDYQDQEDVYRVAVNLYQKLEYGRVMYYKTDDMTRAGLYAHTGSKVNHIYSYPPG
ncbi:hypothetical protein EMPS_00055 [Entomortierella parvispora]|uniref:Crinkler effector protein N-terminal domain-containing protein n=1 Tax=Entomortierella parvispora TaxID=205924 RepID=A0A9P3GZ17_9FUNG|nr:hypothetical protein EMPS_00055 [Entomortierella parvispora]